MPWEQRGRRRYYYRYQETQGCRSRVYVGTGAVGERAAGEDQERCVRR
jgi:hypothetical protein